MLTNRLGIGSPTSALLKWNDSGPAEKRVVTSHELQESSGMLYQRFSEALEANEFEVRE
jgi:hypothetical protein